MTMLKTIKVTLLGFLATFLGTGVLLLLILFPFHQSRLKIVGGKLLENRGMVRKFFATYRYATQDSESPFWLLILGRN